MSRAKDRARKSRSASRPGRQDDLHRILVVSEGALTEPEYFDLLNHHLQGASKTQGNTVRIDAYPKTKNGKAQRASKNNPMDVVEKCIQLRDDDGRKKNKRDVPAYVAAYAVVDVDRWDQPKQGSGNTSPLDKALRKARDHGIHVLVSNPKFELWLVLHTDRAPAQDPKGLDRQCKDSLLDGKNIHAEFPIDQYKRAAERAKKLHKVPVNEIGRPGSTGLFHIIDTIHQYRP